MAVAIFIAGTSVLAARIVSCGVAGMSQLVIFGMPWAPIIAAGGAEIGAVRPAVYIRAVAKSVYPAAGMHNRGSIAVGEGLAAKLCRAFISKAEQHAEYIFKQ
jgi:hypothetical protein